MEQTPQQHQPAQRSWWGRHWKWVVPVGCLTPMLCCGGIITLSVSMVFGMMKGSKPYTYSLATAKANTEVQAALGTPIEAGFLVGGNIQLNGANGNANLIYEITGPNGSGTVHVVGDLSGGQWTYSTLDVTIKATGNQIDLQEAQVP